MPSYDTTSQQRVLRRCIHDQKIAGVASGLADYLDTDVDTVRIALVLLAIFGGLAVPLYAAAWLLIPEEGADTSVAQDLLQHV